MRRSVLLISWLTAIALAAVGAALASRRSGAAPGSPVWEGYLLGAFLIPFLFAIVVRSAFVFLSRRRGADPGRVMGSAWVPLAALIVTGLTIGGTIVDAAPLPRVDPDSAIRISAPFAIRDASQDTVRQIAPLVEGKPTIRSYAVREIVGIDGSVSTVLVVDADIRNKGFVGVVDAIRDGAGVEPTVTSLAGKDVAILVRDQVSLGTWIEEPLEISVYAADEATLRAIIEAMLQTPRS